MDIYNHFSCYTNLPVTLRDVIAQVEQAKVVDEILIHEVEIDASTLRGFCWVFKDKPRNSINHRRVALIGYSNQLSREMARITICKELLHLLDNHHETAGTVERVSRLVDEIVLPIAAQIALPTLQDHAGELKALAVLMPACAIEELRPHLNEGTISRETISRHARIPLEYITLAFSERWHDILRIFGVESDEGSRVSSDGSEPTLPFPSGEEQDSDAKPSTENG